MVEGLFPIQENEYNELLLQTVAVIDNASTSIALHLAATASNTNWETGKLLHEKNDWSIKKEI